MTSTYVAAPVQTLPHMHVTLLHMYILVIYSTCSDLHTSEIFMYLIDSMDTICTYAHTYVVCVCIRPSYIPAAISSGA